MKKREAAVLDKSDLEMVDLLTNLGMDAKMAKVLTFLSQVDEGKSADIEHGCRLRQPEVSLATKDLRSLGWITADERKNGGKGRPVHYYRLSLELPQILSLIEKQKMAEINDEIQKIERLKSLLGR